MMEGDALFPAFRWEIPKYFNIGFACTDAQLRTVAETRPAVIVEHEEAGTVELKYRQLAERTSRFAELLRLVGVKPRDRVLICLPNSIDYPVVFLGTIKYGAIGVPASTLLTISELEYVAFDSGANTLVIDRTRWALDAPKLAQNSTLKHVLLAGKGPYDTIGGIDSHDLDVSLETITTWSDFCVTAADDPAYLVYTSGTTGYPKGVLHAHRALIGHTPAAGHWFEGDTLDDRVIHSGKFNWTYTLGAGLMDPLYRGKTVIAFEGKSDARVWPELIQKHSGTTFVSGPTVFRQILEKTSYRREHVPTLRHCMSAGEHLPETVLAEWRSRFEIGIYEALGMTECSYYISQSKARPIRPGSVGAPQPGHQVRLLNPLTLEEVPANEDGMICVAENDPGLFISYWGLPEETDRCRHDGWFFTGDYARYDSDGYMWVVGRKDDIINSFGYRVSSAEVERVLKTHPDVIDCACVGQAVAPNKIVVVAYVTKRSSSTLAPDELLVFGRIRLASYKSPRIVYFLQDLPRTTSGKIVRRRLDPAAAFAQSGSH